MTQDKHIENLKSQQNVMLEQVIELSSINSGSLNVTGIAEVAAKIKEYFSILNCHVEEIQLQPWTKINDQGNKEQLPGGSALKFSKRPDADIQVLLVGHMDTVFSKEHSFQQITKQGKDIIVGPGVADMKGGIVVMLSALNAFEQTETCNNIGWTVLLTPDEEIGSPGSKEILEELAKENRLGLVFEPALDEKGTLAGERYGSSKFTVVVRGKAAHVGRNFNDGKNAICAISKIIMDIDQLNGQRDSLFINIGKIRGGEAVNVIPDISVCNIDARFATAGDESWLDTQLENIISKANNTQDVTFELHKGISKKPKLLEGKTKQLYELVKEVGNGLKQAVSWQSTGGCCDGNILAAAGLPNVDTLGVCGGKIHSAAEYLIVNSLVKRAQLTTEILVKISKEDV